MLLVGLTGGIGSGKSTVARMLAARGAVVLDADELARRAVEPGTQGYAKVVELFGAQVVGEDGRLDREAMAKRVFAEPDLRRALESITHPEVFREVAAAAEAYRGTDTVLVFDAPLIVETGFASACDVVVLVTGSTDTQVARLMADRGMSDDSARARIAAQAPTEEKRLVADFVIDNDGTLEELEAKVGDLWPRLVARNLSSAP